MKNAVYSVNATDIVIWAKAGLHHEESFVENCFYVSVYVNAENAYTEHNHINYEIIVGKVKKVFSKPPMILEDICEAIISEIKDALTIPLVSIVCEIKKVNPAIEGMKIGSFGVKITREF